MPRSHRGTTHQAGYGWDHQQRRARLLAAHIDGTECPCPWWIPAGEPGACGPRCPCRAAGAPLPMYRDPYRNPDGRRLQADHSTARILGGGHADRLMLAVCNLSAGAALGNRLRRTHRARPPLPEW